MLLISNRTHFIKNRCNVASFTHADMRAKFVSKELNETKTTLSNLLTKVKDPTSNENKVGAVYKIMCECGDFYIGESGRALGIRIKEHKSACEHGYFTISPLAEHVWQEGSHVIHWNQVKLLDFSQGIVERKVKEAIYITSDVLEHKWRASCYRLYYFYMNDFDF